MGFLFPKKKRRSHMAKTEGRERGERERGKARKRGLNAKQGGKKKGEEIIEPKLSGSSTHESAAFL